MNKKERRDHIVQSAKELFVASGFHNTSIADIIERAKIARSTFYQHFDNKMDIFSLLVDSFADILLQAILNINISKAEKQRDLAEEIRAMTVVLVRAIDENKDLARLLITAPQGHDTSFDKKISDFYTQIIAAINTLLVEGIAAARSSRSIPASYPTRYLEISSRSSFSGWYTGILKISIWCLTM
jgi:AcrR family transcriptional regulator